MTSLKTKNKVKNFVQCLVTDRKSIIAYKYYIVILFLYFYILQACSQASFCTQGSPRYGNVNVILAKRLNK